MNCCEFEESWNELLDARTSELSGLEIELAAHASVCEGCRAVSARYQVLRHAVSAWCQPPAPSSESIERLLASTRSLVIAQKPKRPWMPMAAAAAILAMAWVGHLVRVVPTGPAPTPEPSPSVSVSASRPLGIALAEATEATLDLARETSAPAARIGREVLEFETIGSAEKPETAGRSSVGSSASVMIQSVGERVNASVKPISGSARHAFGFLLNHPRGPEDAQDSL